MRIRIIISKFPHPNVDELKALFSSLSEEEQETFLNELEGISISNVEDKVEEISSEVNESVNEDLKSVLAGIALLLGSTLGHAQVNNLPKDKIEQSINQELSKLPKSGVDTTFGKKKEIGTTHFTKTIPGKDKDTLVIYWKKEFKQTDVVKTVTVNYNEEFVMSPPKGQPGSDSYELAQTVNNVHNVIQNLQDGQEIDWSKIQSTTPGDSVITWAGKGDNKMVVKMFLKKTFNDNDNIAIGDIYGYKDGKTWEIDANGNPIGLEVIAKKGEKVPPGTVGYFLLGQWNVETKVTSIELVTPSQEEWITKTTISKPEGGKGRTGGTHAKPYKGKCPSGR
jgi:hypothetical protein